MIQGRVAGFLRILGTGRLADIGNYYRNPDEIKSCPNVLTGIDAQEAEHRARKKIIPEPGEVASGPVYVHDGPIGREAWLIETFKENKPYRWIFITSASIYERPAGNLLDEAVE